MRGRLLWLGAVASAWGVLELASAYVASAQTASQTVLGPGLYVFQTRTRSSTCGDAEKDGFVLSYVAAVDGVPGATAMSMQLVNTQHFSDWKLEVASSGEVSGKSRLGEAADAPESHFTVKRDGDRFKGTGERTYNGVLNGAKTRCRVEYDALLKRLDT